MADDEQELRSALTKLAYDNHELREKVLPLLREAGGAVSALKAADDKIRAGKSATADLKKVLSHLKQGGTRQGLSQLNFAPSVKVQSGDKKLIDQINTVVAMQPAGYKMWLKTGASNEAQHRRRAHAIWMKLKAEPDANTLWAALAANAAHLAADLGLEGPHGTRRPAHMLTQVVKTLVGGSRLAADDEVTKEAADAQVPVDRRALGRAIGKVMSEYQEYGADPEPQNVASEAINLLYGRNWSERELSGNLKGSFKSMYEEAQRLAKSEIAHF